LTSTEGGDLPDLLSPERARLHPSPKAARAAFSQGVIASEAKQSILSSRGTMDCFASLAMTGSNKMPRFVLPLLLALAGLILFGQGAYIHAKARLAQILLERAFEQTIATGRETKPWSWADTWPVARIEVKRIHASAIVLAGSSGQALAFGPGHVERTPDAGERGVAVYSAHRDTHFAFLKDVVVGDEIGVMRSDGKQFRYRVDTTSVVRFDASGIDPLADGHQLVLSTCWPFDALTQGLDRYLVHATMLGNAPGSR
jgi:sortase A